MLISRSMLIASQIGPIWRFNPADVAAFVTVSNGDRTISQSSGGITNARGTLSKTSGKWYAELQTAAASGGAVFGIATSAHTLDLDQIGGDTPSCGYGAGGALERNGSVVATYTAWGAGDVVGMALDRTSNLIWFSKNGVWQAGNPAAGTGGVSVSAGTYFPAATVANGDPLTIPQALKYPPPSGFQIW